MILETEVKEREEQTVPRMSGGDPYGGGAISVSGDCSPHERG